MDGGNGAEHFETVIIGGGQAGLTVGYHLTRRDRPFVILDANERIGDAWRKRWDSLRLFTAAGYDGLQGMPFPGRRCSFPTKDEMADYLEAYAARFDLPVRTGGRVDGLSRDGSRYVLTAGDLRLEADRVVVASGACQTPRVPPFAQQLDPGIVQLHSSRYQNPAQLREGGVLVVDAGNSGAEIALEVSRTHPTWLSGRHPGHIFVRHGEMSAQFFPSHRAVRRPPGADPGHADRPEGAPRRSFPEANSSSGSSPKTSTQPGSNASPGSWGRGTDCPCWRTNGSWRWRTSPGARGSASISRGSTSPSSGRSASRCTSAGSSRTSRDCTSSASTSSMCSRRSGLPASAGTPSTSPSTSPHTDPTVGLRRNCWPAHETTRRPIIRGAEEPDREPAARVADGHRPGRTLPAVSGRGVGRALGVRPARHGRPPIQRSLACAALASSLERHAGVQVAAAARWLFSLSEPEDLRAFLADAGFDGIRVHTARKTTRFPSVTEFLRGYVPRVPGRPRHHAHARERQAQDHRRSRDRPGRLGRRARADDHDASQHGSCESLTCTTETMSGGSAGHRGSEPATRPGWRSGE
jgi:hypothetical protein